jgi:hypothetical protein
MRPYHLAMSASIFIMPVIISAMAWQRLMARGRQRLTSASRLYEPSCDDSKGPDKIIQALCRLRTRYPRRQVIRKAVAYFREHPHRMPYARLRSQHLPIGSGVVEAACKTLATQRLKRSGMCWRQAGGQAILTFRSLWQSDRFERAWELLAATYKRSVELSRKVIALSDHREKV